MAISSWRIEIQRRLSVNSEAWSDVVHSTLSSAELDEPFDNGRHGTGKPFYVWTRRFVYFNIQIDGYPRCGSAPLAPEERIPG